MTAIAAVAALTAASDHVRVSEMADGQTDDHCRQLAGRHGRRRSRPHYRRRSYEEVGHHHHRRKSPWRHGNIGQASFVEAEPDGYNWLHTSPGPAANNMVSFKSLPYNPLTDFTPITMTNETDMVLVGVTSWRRI